MKKEKIIFAILLISFLASCGPKRYGCGPRRCEVKKIEVPTIKSNFYNKTTIV